MLKDSQLAGAVNQKAETEFRRTTPNVQNKTNEVLSIVMNAKEMQKHNPKAKEIAVVMNGGVRLPEETKADPKPQQNVTNAEMILKTEQIVQRELLVFQIAKSIV